MLMPQMLHLSCINIRILVSMMVSEDFSFHAIHFDSLIQLISMERIRMLSLSM